MLEELSEKQSQGHIFETTNGEVIWLKIISEQEEVVEYKRWEVMYILYHDQILPIWDECCAL